MTKQSSSVGRSRKAKERSRLQKVRLAKEREREVEAIASSETRFDFFLFSTIDLGTLGVKEMPNASEPYPPHPPLTAKLSSQMARPTMGTTVRRNREKEGRTRSVVLQPVTTAIKNSESRKANGNKSAPKQQADVKRAQSDEKAMVSPVLLGCTQDSRLTIHLDSDPSPEPAPSKTLNAEASLPTFATPTPPLPKPSHKKTGRPPAKRGRVGRNQYTRDRDPPANADLNTSPARSNGSNGDDRGTPHINGTHSPSTHANKPDAGGTKSKLKHLNPNRTTMNDMKRRVAAILEFILHTQSEMASSDPTRASSTITPPDSGGSKEGGMAQKLLEGQNGLMDDLEVDGFRELSSVEMMEVLTRRLVKWQGEYGKWGDK